MVTHRFELFTNISYSKFHFGNFQSKQLTLKTTIFIYIQTADWEYINSSIMNYICKYGIVVGFKSRLKLETLVNKCFTSLIIEITNSFLFAAIIQNLEFD